MKSQILEPDDMAGDWIKMRTALANDPAVIAIALDLDKSEFEVVGMLHHLWSWADSQSQDGHVKRVTEKWIDRYVHHSGFAKSMSDAGWLIIENDGITFPNFDRHNGESAKKRAEAAERQRISRANKAAADVTDQSQESCDESVTREEKSKSKDQDQKIPPTPKPAKSKPVLLTLDDLVGFGVDNQHAADWLLVRKQKKAALTPTAWKRMVIEAEKAGITPAHAVQIAAEKSWQSFDSTYNWRNQNVAGTNAGTNRQSRPSLVEQVRQRGRELEAERDGAARREASPTAELWDTGMEAPGIDWDGEFSSIDDADGSLVGVDDRAVWPQMD
jgi:hypothetical protein